MKKVLSILILLITTSTIFSQTRFGRGIKLYNASEITDFSSGYEHIPVMKTNGFINRYIHSDSLVLNSKLNDYTKKTELSYPVDMPVCYNVTKTESVSGVKAYSYSSSSFTDIQISIIINSEEFVIKPYSKPYSYLNEPNQYKYANYLFQKKINNYNAYLWVRLNPSFPNNVYITQNVLTNSNTTNSVFGGILTFKDINGNVLTYGEPSSGSDITNNWLSGVFPINYDGDAIIRDELDYLGNVISGKRVFFSKDYNGTINPLDIDSFSYGFCEPVKINETLQTVTDNGNNTTNSIITGSIQAKDEILIYDNSVNDIVTLKMGSQTNNKSILSLDIPDNTLSLYDNLFITNNEFLPSPNVNVNLGRANTQQFNEVHANSYFGSGANLTNVLNTIQAGSNITIDNTDPKNPIINSTGTGGGGSGLNSVVGGTNITVDNADPSNPVINTDAMTFQQLRDSLSIYEAGGNQLNIFRRQGNVLVAAWDPGYLLRLIGNGGVWIGSVSGGNKIVHTVTEADGMTIDFGGTGSSGGQIDEGFKFEKNQIGTGFSINTFDSSGSKYHLISKNAVTNGVVEINKNSTGDVVIGGLTKLRAILQNSSAPPTSSTDSGTQGEIRYDSNYLYICIGTGTIKWKRIPLTNW